MKIEKIEVHPFKLEGVLPSLCEGRTLSTKTYTDVDFKEFLNLLPGEDFNDKPWSLTTTAEHETYWNEYLSQIVPTLTEQQITRYLLINEHVVFEKGSKFITLHGLQPGTLSHTKVWHECIDALYDFHNAFCMFVAEGVVTLKAFNGTVISAWGYGVNSKEVGNNINPRYNTPNDSTYFA